MEGAAFRALSIWVIPVLCDPSSDPSCQEQVLIYCLTPSPILPPLWMTEMEAPEPSVFPPWRPTPESGRGGLKPRPVLHVFKPLRLGFVLIFLYIFMTLAHAAKSPGKFGVDISIGMERSVRLWGGKGLTFRPYCHRLVG